MSQQQQWQEALAALGPLRVRAHQLQQQAAREHEAAEQRWQQSEKPVLKEHAAGMKQTLQLLTEEEAALQARVASFSTNSVPNHPGTSTGFNVIRARVDAFGKPLSTDALRAERDRLLKTIDTLEVEIAGAKAEITQHRRLEELEIWETKLVALQVRRRRRRPLGRRFCSNSRRCLHRCASRRAVLPPIPTISPCLAALTACAGHQAGVPRRDQPD